MSTEPRRIGINAIFLEPGMGGLETYVREIVPRLAAQATRSEITVVCNPRARAALKDEPWAGDIELATPPLFGRPGLKAIAELTALGAYASRHFDALLNVALTAPLATRAANVVLLADTTWVRFPKLDDGNNFTPRLWRAIVPTVARRADRVIALTESGADDIVDYLGVERSRVDVIGLGFDAIAPATAMHPTQLRDRLGIGDGPLVLNVAAKKAHKNLLRLVEAMAEVRRHVPDVQLVLPGAPTRYEDDLRRRADQLGIGGAVILPGFVNAAELEGLYAIADCFAFPSLNEGFGLPLLEAMARDLPIVCADASALPEVVGDGAVLVDPLSVTAIAQAITAVLSDAELRRRLIAAGRERLPLFTWERCAGATLETLSRAADQKRQRR